MLDTLGSPVALSLRPGLAQAKPLLEVDPEVFLADTAYDADALTYYFSTLDACVRDTKGECSSLVGAETAERAQLTRRSGPTVGQDGSEKRSNILSSRSADRARSCNLISSFPPVT